MSDDVGDLYDDVEDVVEGDVGGEVDGDASNDVEDDGDDDVNLLVAMKGSFNLDLGSRSHILLPEYPLHHVTVCICKF